MEAFGISLALLGATSIVAALAGALNLVGVAEIPAMKSKSVRVVLFLVGVVFLLLGFGAIEQGSANTSAIEGGSTETSPPGENPDPPPPSGDPEDGVQVYRNAANAACGNVETAWVALPVPDENAGDDEWVAFALDAADMMDGLHEDLSTLMPPGAMTQDHDTLLTHLGNLRDSWESAGVALRAGDPWGFDQHLEWAEGYAADFDRVAKRLSLASCVLS